MKKSLLLVLLCLFMFAQSFAQWQKAKLPANNAILSLAVDYSTSYVYAGSAGNGVYISADTGATWKTANTGLPANLNVWNILIQNKNIFLATNDGVYSSANNGTSWQQAGLKGVLVKSLSSQWTGDPTFLYAGTEKGIYMTKNNSQSWSLYAFANSEVSTIYTNGPNFYAGMKAGGLNYSTDYGKNWAAADKGITNKTIVKTFHTGFVGTNHGVFMEKSKGNWVPVNNGLDTDSIINSIYYGADQITGANHNILVGTNEGNVYYSTTSISNGDIIWEALSTGIDGKVNALARYRDIVFAGGTDLWVLKSNLYYMSISNSIGVLSASGDTATFKVFSNDSWFFLPGNNWLTFSPNTGTGDAIITVIAAPNNTKDIRFGFIFINAEATLSFYQEAANTTGIDNAPSANVNIYPVPVKDELVISVPNQPNNIRFVIYNLSGMELLAAQLTGSVTKVNMNGFKPGVYVLKIYSGNTCTTQKIIKQ